MQKSFLTAQGKGVWGGGEPGASLRKSIQSFGGGLLNGSALERAEDVKRRGANPPSQKPGALASKQKTAARWACFFHPAASAISIQHQDGFRFYFGFCCYRLFVRGAQPRSRFLGSSSRVCWPAFCVAFFKFLALKRGNEIVHFLLCSFSL